MNLLDVIILGVVIFYVIDALFVLPGATLQYCAECGTRTYRHGMLMWSCCNPDHVENCARLEKGGDA